MRKISSLLFLIAVAFSSCQDKGAFIVEGSFTESAYNDKTVYLQELDSLQMPVVIDSSIVKDSKFQFKGILKNDPSVGFVSVGKLSERNPYQPDDSPVGTLILESGTIHITFDKTAVVVSGTARNDEFNKVYVKLNEVSALYKEVADAGGIGNVPLDDKGQDIQTRMENHYKEVIELSYIFTKANINNSVGEYFFRTSGNSFTKEQMIELIGLSSSEFQNSNDVKEIKEFYEKAMKSEAKILNKPFKDVELMNQAGKKVSLSTYVGKGKYVLIDFWASWCGPCIAEVPNLTKAYDKYKTKGFEIVGISLDEDLTAWTGAIEAKKMSWIQLHDAEGTAANLYGVNSIPYTLLVDDKGTIVAMNLRGTELEKKLEELIK